MNSVYHIRPPDSQTLPWSFYQEFLGKYDRKDKVAGKYAAYVERAIPICKGDFYEDFQVIATTSDYFQNAGESGREEHRADDFRRREVVPTTRISDRRARVVGGE